MNQEFTGIAIYERAGAARQNEIEAALERDIDVPTEVDIEALISARESSQSQAAISPAVLDNIQKTTGISPEEINNLMNQ
jgi:hypothetical protein